MTRWVPLPMLEQDSSMWWKNHTKCHFHKHGIFKANQSCFQNLSFLLPNRTKQQVKAPVVCADVEIFASQNLSLCIQYCKLHQIH